VATTIVPWVACEDKMRRKISVLFPLMLLCLLSTFSHAQNWSGILDPTRAIDWSSTGVSGGIPTNRTQCGSTIAAYTGTAVAINSALATCGANQYVLLGPGTFNLSTGIDFADHSNITLRGSGPDSTFLIFTGDAGCAGLQSSICLENADNAYPLNTLGHSANWTGGYAQGSTSITIDFKDSSLQVGSVLMLGQCNTGYSGNATTTGGGCSNGSSSDNGQIFMCDDGGVCSTEGGEGITQNERAQGQAVVVTSISGSGPYTIGINPGIYMPNYAAASSPGAWWMGDVIHNDGVESLSLDSTNSGGNYGIAIFDARDIWIKNVRSLRPNRSHVRTEDVARLTVRDSYLYGTQNASSESYGFELDLASDVLVENNIVHHVTAPLVNGKQTSGVVYGYNFTINDFYTPSPQWMQASSYFHAAGLNYILYEGNDAASAETDIIHGTGHFLTGFRNRWHGWEPCADTPGCTGSKTLATEAVVLWAFNRYFNFVGNVLGTSAYHTGYECFTVTSTDGCTSYNAGNLAVYEMGYSNLNSWCNNCGGAGSPPNDGLVRKTLMRWGNYDTVNASNQFNASEVPSTISPYGNAVPNSQSLPPSFYLSSAPSWWGTVAWPAIGPDVSGGNLSGVAGHANLIPAGNCYLNVMGGPADGSGSALTFNANNCYTNLPPPNPPTGLSAVVQ
jgi:hypothetical protein